MKEYIQLLLAMAVVLALIPLVSIAGHRAHKSSAADISENVSILFEESGEVETLTMREYIIGAVFAQMPADFEEEALKAQAVLAATYAQRRQLAESESPTKELNGAIISDDTEKYQAYFTEEQARELYGENYDKSLERIESAADYAINRVLCYEDEPILVAFHGISFGSTESAFTMWGEDIPYLQSVDSNRDSELDECQTKVNLSDSELENLFSSAEISVAEQSEHGTVLKLRIGDNITDAADFCERAGLASQHFTFERKDGGIEFTVQGCGHLVGMSQYGANEMAADGSTCEEILLHYFPGTVINVK